MTDQAKAVAAAIAHIQSRGPAVLDEFCRLLRLSNLARNLPDVEANADHIVGMLNRRGIEARVESMDGAAPLVVGHLRRPGTARTIGIYAHYDGQPVDQPEWVTDPFTPTLAGPGGEPVEFPEASMDIDPEWRLFARSAADDKAPIAALCAALDAVHAAGLTPVANLVFAFEGEEEIGSPHLSSYLDRLRNELAADVWLICDGPVHQSRRPQVVFGVRGIAEMEITAYGPNRPLHSGHYGNWAPNPNILLAQLIASMKDDDGNVTIDGFYDGTEPITDADRAAVAALPNDDERLRYELGLGATEDGGAAHALRMLIPSLNVRGWQGGGVGSEAANVLPTRATASIDIRLAPGNDADALLDRVEAHIRKEGWHIVYDEPDDDTRRAHPRVARVWRKAWYPGFRTRTDTAVAKSILAAVEAAAGQAVVALPILGGSVPIHHFHEILGAPVAITPFANHDNNQHAANENLRIANLWYGVRLMAALMFLDCEPSVEPSDGRRINHL
jgi:acetylornithine deacetylase/succinyl-diaminopimelate desuccinylase-like protein